MRGFSLAVCTQLLSLAYVAQLHAQAPAPVALVDSVVAHEMQLRRVPGVAIAVVENGSVVLQRAYGTANLETGTPLRVDAVFELASVTKQFTAAAIMLLAEEGKVGLDETIGRYIDNVPATWAAITVRQLLTHTGGLDTNAVVRHDGSALLNITTRHAFDFVAQQPLRFPPGQEGWYSDAGYFLLGIIIEKASGRSYRQFLQQRIFDPLGMTKSSVLNKARVLPGRVATYILREGEHLNWRRDWDYELPSFFGIFSTLDDLAKWDAALRSATLLKPASLQQMWTPAKLDNGQLARVFDRFYGFGFELSDLRGRRTVGHGGASGTYMLRFLDEPLTIIVLSNLETVSGARHPVLLARSIAGALRPEYRPANMLTAQRDPEPAFTRDVATLLTDLTANRESPIMSPAYRTWYATALGFRSFWGNQMRGFTALTFLGADDVRGKALWDAEPLERLVHYRTEVGGRAFFVTIGVNGAGKVGRLELLAYR